MRWFAWVLTCVFLFYEYFLRTSPSVILPALMRDFGVSAAAVGALSGFYFYVYAPMQIPVGVLLDRFGAKLLMTMATAVCGLGGVLFGVATAYWLAAAGRVLMGFGSSFAFVGMVYVSSHWFPPSLLALLVGLGNSVASLGAVFGQGPLAIAVRSFGWRGSLIFMGIVGLVLAVFMYFAMRRDIPPHSPHEGHETSTMWHNLWTVCKNGQSWLNGAVALFSYVTTNSFAGLWSVPFLVAVYHLTEETAGFAASMIYIGWIVAGPLVGLISDWLGHRRIVMKVCFALAFLALLPIIFMNSLALWLIYLLMFLIGAFSSGQLLNFSLAIEMNPLRVKGTATAFTNFLVAGAGAVMQPLVGVFLDLLAPGVPVVNGNPLYSPANYRIALSLFPILMLVAFILAFFLKPRRQKVVEGMMGLE
jgi:MFS family permease